MDYAIVITWLIGAIVVSYGVFKEPPYDNLALKAYRISGKKFRTIKLIGIGFLSLSILLAAISRYG